jgi:autotransporter-associated beta strand protein
LECRLSPATHVWTGLGADANWTTAANWAGNVAPNPSDGADNLVFPAAALQLNNTNDFAAGTTFRSITFNGAGYTIAGNQVRLLAGVRAGAVVGENTFAPDILLARSQTFAVGDSALVRLTGAVDGPGGLTKRGPGMLVLAGANTYAGLTRIEAGAVNIQNGSALGSLAAGTVVRRNAVLQMQGDISVAERLVLGGRGSRGGTLWNTGGSNTWTGNIAVRETSILRVDDATSLQITGGIGLGNQTLVVSSAGTTILSETIRGGSRSRLFKEDIGTLVLSGAGTYSGRTRVRDGTLLVNGDLSSLRGVNVENAATLGGEGAIGGRVTVQGGTIAPGVSPGNLSVGGVNFTPGSFFTVELKGTIPGSDYDQLDVSGRVVLGGSTLVVTLNFPSTIGNSFTIIDNGGTDPIVGTFDGLNEGDAFIVNGLVFQITYVGGTGNDVVLTQVG